MGRFALSLGKLAQSGGDGFVAGLTEKIFAEVKKQFGGKLRLIITGAAALNPEVARDFKTFGLPVYIGYGLTTDCSCRIPSACRFPGSKRKLTRPM